MTGSFTLIVEPAIGTQRQWINRGIEAFRSQTIFLQLQSLGWVIRTCYWLFKVPELLGNNTELLACSVVCVFTVYFYLSATSKCSACPALRDDTKYEWQYRKKIKKYFRETYAAEGWSRRSQTSFRSSFSSDKEMLHATVYIKVRSYARVFVCLFF